MISKVVTKGGHYYPWNEDQKVQAGYRETDQTITLLPSVLKSRYPDCFVVFDKKNASKVITIPFNSVDFYEEI